MHYHPNISPWMRNAYCGTTDHECSSRSVQSMGWFLTILRKIYCLKPFQLPLYCSLCCWIVFLDKLLTTTLRFQILQAVLWIYRKPKMSRNLSQQCALVAKVASSFLCCARQSIISKSREMILPIFSALVRHLEGCVHFWDPIYNKDRSLLELFTVC